MMTFITKVEGAENLEALEVEAGLFDPLFQE
jgi:hypothetical protein